MSRTNRASFRLLAALAIVVMSGSFTSGQRAFRQPLTPWGDPDLQGVWPSGQLNAVPFERPQELGTRAVLTEAEFAERDRELRRQLDADNAATVAPGSSGVNPPSHWLELAHASRQASLIVDPPDGRLPPMTADGARRAKVWSDNAASAAFERPEDFNVYDRCISRGVLGSAFPNIYSTGTEIMQAPGLVIIRHEMIHETRVIPLDGRPHVSGAIRSYMGDPRGRWDGNTLVVETTNFNGKTGSYGRNGNGNPTSDALRLTERFTLTDANTLKYHVTIDDPKTWTRPWAVAFSLERDSGYVMYEYACHEGNYAIANMMRGARAAERSAK